MKYLKGFIGVYSSNNAPLLKTKMSSVIINFDKKNEPGSHFVAFFMNDKFECFYFDPLNVNLIPIEISEYIKKYDIIFDASENIQSFFSTYCGFYCMLFLFCININVEYWNNTAKFFKQRSMENDKKCIKMLCKSIKKYFS